MNEERKNKETSKQPSIIIYENKNIKRVCTFLNSASLKGSNFDFSYKNIQKLHFEESLHYTKQWQQSEQKHALHEFNKNSFEKKIKQILSSIFFALQ